ncbi:MAG TPA: prepilin-type N-terminal cleavage/methylation domain-containing protein [Planctomycetota bacterium]|nr:prepilin-type N-terminal cleavage/methylation domain-containing protein [Planctomycetota bacterium]
MDHHHPVLKRGIVVQASSLQRKSHAGWNPAPQGFTLIEMALVLAMSSVLLIAFYAFMSTQTMNAFEDSSEITVQSGIRTTMAALVQELEGAHLFALDSNANWVCYQIPMTGPSGSIVLDSNGNIQYGAIRADMSGWTNGVPNGWLAGGYYEIIFVDDTTKPPLVESQMTTPATPNGQNISGTFATGATNFTVAYDKAFYYGSFQQETHTAPPNGTINVNGPTGVLTGPTRVLPGICLRMYDKNDTSTPKRTWPWRGGFFYMRNISATPTLNAAGTGPGTVWSPQTAGTYTDTNGNGVWDVGEPFTDIDGDGMFEDADCEPFVDANGNNVKDTLENFTDTNGNGKWDGSLRVQIRAFDAQKIVGTSGNQRDNSAAVRTLSTKVKIRN